MIYQESKFDADARLEPGAIGLMQLLPATAKGIADADRRLEVPGLRPHNPEINVRYGSWYLRHLLDKYGDGAHGARRLQRRPGTTSTAGARRGIGIQFDETKTFVDHVERLKQTYRDDYSALRQGASG